LGILLNKRDKSGIGREEMRIKDGRNRRKQGGGGQQRSREVVTRGGCDM